MKNRSIALKIFMVVTSLLILAFFLVFLIVKFQFAKVIDTNQRMAYTEKVNFIVGILDRNLERLNATQQRAVYEESFQDSVLKSLHQAYYKTSDQKTYPVILDGQGKILLHPFLPRAESFPELQLHMQKILTLQTGEFDFLSVAGEKKWAIFNSFPEWNWHVAFIVPWDVKYAEAKGLRNYMLLTMAVVILFVSAILLIIILKITEPILALTTASKAMAEGNLVHPLDIRRNDELGILASSFIQMRDAIGEKIEALIQSEARISQVIDRSPIAMAVSTPDNRIVSFNQKFISLFGYTVEDIQHITQWYPRAYPDKKEQYRIGKRWEKAVANFLESGKFNTLVEPVVCKDGTIKIIEFDFEAVGEQYITSFTDLTEKKAAQRALLKEKEFSEYIINSMPGIFFLFAMENGFFLLKRWNKNYNALLGYQETDLKNSRVEDFFEKKNQEEIQAAIAELTKNGRVILEIEVLKKDGAVIPFYIQAFRFKEGGKIYMMGTGVDIRERKIAEKENQDLQIKLVQAQKMEAIGTLSGGIAHDFNNILSGILGYSQLAETNIQNPEKAKKHIQQIIKGAYRATDLVQQILTFSRQKEYQKNALDINILVKEVIALLRPSIPVTIEIREEIAPTPSILADATQMHQVILNLCTNAYHAMSDTGGIMTIGVKEIEILGGEIYGETVTSAGTYLELKIGDTGHGMDKDILDKVFDPYFTTKDAGKGTGIGLALVGAIVAEHNGFVKVESRVGQGSTFYVYFPAAEIMTPDPPKKTKSVVERGTETIMVVDDEPGIRNLFKELLSSWGYDVFLFQNGTEAYAAFKKDPQLFDLIITDMTMPLMTGEELSMKVLMIQKNMPIILCTGYNENISEATAIQMGIRKFFKKPVESKTLAAAIREALEV